MSGTAGIPAVQGGEEVKEIRHGTPGGWKKCKPRCDRCRAWARESMRDWRARHPGYGAVNSRVYYAALAALRDSYPDEFDKLLAYYRERPEEIGGGAV